MQRPGRLNEATVTVPAGDDRIRSINRI